MSMTIIIISVVVLMGGYSTTAPHCPLASAVGFLVISPQGDYPRDVDKASRTFGDALKEWMAAGSSDAARGAARRARPNIKNAASSMSTPTATPTPVINKPHPYGNNFHHLCISEPSSGQFVIQQWSGCVSLRRPLGGR